MQNQCQTKWNLLIDLTFMLQGFCFFREKQMPVDQDWGNVWPGPRSFHPASVPLPIRQGFVEKGSPPSKYANAELMKIPNFLHLTPPVIKRQCEALKKFCTPWPKALDTDEKCEKHFPIEVTTSDYCHSSPSIRDPLARIVTVRIKLSSLELNARARDKFLRLVGDKYDEKTDIVTIVTDRCPLRQQNYDYALYLITACFHESWVRISYYLYITFPENSLQLENSNHIKYLEFSIHQQVSCYAQPL